MFIKPAPLLQFLLAVKHFLSSRIYSNQFKYFNSILKIKLILIGLLILSSVTNPQDKNTNTDIKGYVKDKQSGEALVYANVIIKSTNYGATTNDRGYFVIVDAPQDTCILIISYIGYVTQQIIVDNNQGNAGQLVIELAPKAIESEEVLVVAEEYKMWKNAEEVSQITISPKEISYLPRLGEVDIFRSLQLLPGISGISDGSAGLYIRGGTPDQNLVLLDGMTVYHVDHFFGFFSSFNAEAIKDVQLYKGGYPSGFGGRLSSVVDLTGKTGNVNKFKLSLGANLLSVNGVAEIPFGGNGSILISARRSFADFIESPAYNTIFSFLTGEDEPNSLGSGGGRGGGKFAEQTVLPSFYFYDLNTKISYQVSDKDFLAFSFYNGEDYLDESQDPEEFTLNGSENTGTRSTTDLTNWGNLGLSFKWARQWSDRIFSDFIISNSNYFSDHNQERSFDLNVENDSSSFSANSFKSIQNNNVSDLSFRFDNEWNANANHKIGFGTWVSNIGTEYEFTVNDTLNIVGRDGNAWQTSIYLDDKWQVFNSLELKLGARGTYYDQTNAFYFEPRASFTYNLLDNWKLKGAWGHYNQFINRIVNEDVLEGSNDFWLLADETLKPGFSEHFILGTEYETDNYLFSIEGYYKNLENLLEFTQRVRRNPRDFGNDADNFVANFFTGTGVAKGIEFLAQKKFGALNGWVSYTLANTEYTFPEFDNGDPFPASQDRIHEVKLVGAYTLGKWNFSAAWIYATGQAYTAPESQYYLTLLNGETESYFHVSEKNSYRLPDYQRLDLSVAYRFKNKSLDGEFGLSVFNVYNHKNVWYKKYDLDVSPIVITDVAMLGITPSVFIKLNF